jgi:hypothetical protein
MSKIWDIWEHIWKESVISHLSQSQSSVTQSSVTVICRSHSHQSHSHHTIITQSSHSHQSSVIKRTLKPNLQLQIMIGDIAQLRLSDWITMDRLDMDCLDLDRLDNRNLEEELAGTGILFLVWIWARGRAISDRAATIGVMGLGDWHWLCMCLSDRRLDIGFACCVSIMYRLSDICQQMAYGLSGIMLV